MSTTLILGGGFGGQACARALRARLGSEHRILLVDRADRFVVGAAKTWVMLGERAAEQAGRDLAALLPGGVERVRDEVLEIDPSTRRVATRMGTLEGDRLVIALGAERDPGAVPGLAEGAHGFYSLEDALRLRGTLGDFSGGRLVLLVARAPFPCPPAPYEAAMLLHEWLGRRGLREATRLEVWTVEKAPMATAGPEMSRSVVADLAARGIDFHPLRKAVAVDPASRVVRFEDGHQVAYQLLVAVPPHRVPGVVERAGLADPGGWVPVDPRTLRVRAPGVAPGVFAIGDLTGIPLPGRHDPGVPLALPKAGVFAASQGETVAATIAAEIQGGPPPPGFDGRGFCYIEVGEGRAIRADGSFFEMPRPVMSARPPDESQYRDKLAWIESWLTAR